MNTVELREEKYVDQGKMNGPTPTKIKSAWSGFCPVADDNTLLYAASYGPRFVAYFNCTSLNLKSLSHGAQSFPTS